MAISELNRIGEIDRSERITQRYASHGGALDLVDVDIDAPRWGEPGEHTVQHYVDTWRPVLEAGGVLVGAFDGDRLVGFAIYEPAGDRSFANFAALHVSRPYRRAGVGRALSDEVVKLARADGAKRLYVSATPTRGTVDFYVRQGFEPLAKPDEKMLAREPDDVHLDRKL